MDTYIKQLIEEVLRVQGKQGMLIMPRMVESMTTRKHKNRADLTRNFTEGKSKQVRIHPLAVDELVSVDDEDGQDDVIVVRQLKRTGTLRSLPGGVTHTNGYLSMGRVAEPEPKQH